MNENSTSDDNQCDTGDAEEFSDVQLNAPLVYQYAKSNGRN